MRELKQQEEKEKISPRPQTSYVSAAAEGPQRLLQHLKDIGQQRQNLNLLGRIKQERRVRPFASAIVFVVTLAIVLAFGAFLLLDIYAISLSKELALLQQQGVMGAEEGLQAKIITTLWRSDWLKLLTVAFCAILSFLLWPAAGQLRRHALNRAAFVFTLAADIYLLILHQYALGIILFVSVQTVRLVLLAGRRPALGPLLFALLAGFVALNIGPEPLRWGEAIPSRQVIFGLGAGYAVLLISNIIFAFATTSRTWKSSARYIPSFAERWAWRLGMLLFAACDTCVMLSFLLPVEHKVYALCSLLTWLFYIPSQYLLAIAPSLYLADGDDLGSIEAQKRLEEIRPNWQQLQVGE